MYYPALYLGLVLPKNRLTSWDIGDLMDDNNNQRKKPSRFQQFAEGAKEFAQQPVKVDPRVAEQQARESFYDSPEKKALADKLFEEARQKVGTTPSRFGKVKEMMASPEPSVKMPPPLAFPAKKPLVEPDGSVRPNMLEEAPNEIANMTAGLKGMERNKDPEAEAMEHWAMQAEGTGKEQPAPKDGYSDEYDDESMFNRNYRKGKR